MCELIRFPNTRECTEFYKFLVRWQDGVEFRGNSLEDCFTKQKDLFESEFSLDEYLERFRQRLKVYTGKEYAFTDVQGLCNILCDLGLLEVLEVDDD